MRRTARHLLTVAATAAAVATTLTCLSAPAATSAPVAAVSPALLSGNDFDGDGHADPATFNRVTKQWQYPGAGDLTFGRGTDYPVPADYDGDGRTEAALYRAGLWYVTGKVTPIAFGRATDYPVPGDWDGDGSADVAVYRPGTQEWFVRGITTFKAGLPGDLPLVADFNGDGRVDAALYRPKPGLVAVRGESQYRTFAQLPGSRWTDPTRLVPLTADTDGDGKANAILYDRSLSTWYVDGKADPVRYGTRGDWPVPGDYAGSDGKAEFAVMRPTTSTAGDAGHWLIRGVSPNAWVRAGDVPARAETKMLMEVYGLR